MDYPYWINDPDFDLEFHVRWRPEPEPRPAELLVRAGINNARRSLRTGATLARKLEQAVQSRASSREDEKPRTGADHALQPGHFAAPGMGRGPFSAG
jgi:hypothetical protein